MQFATQPIWSPFSTPMLTSQFDSSDQTYFQFSSTTIEVIKPIDSPFRKNIPKPISRPSRRDINQLQCHYNDSSNFKRSLPKRSQNVDMSEYLRQDNRSSNRSKICSFCRANGEEEMIYRSHSLKTPGNKISCPVLMKHTCEACGATGENTHTIKYCPVMQKKQKLNLLNNLINRRV